MPEPALEDAARSGGCADAVGEEWVRQDRLSRVTHAAGKGYPDLVRMRSGAPRERAGRGRVPGERRRGAGGARRVRRGGRRGGPVRRRHQRRGRGRAAARRPMEAAISLDLGRIDHARAGRQALADRRAGRRPARARGRERARGGTGLTLGHFPQSWEYATLGGWVATRSAGQASTGYGSIDKLVAGLRCVAPVGRDRAARRCPATAAGPGLRQLLVGSEGVLGVITEATVRVRPLPDATHYEGWMFRGFEQGAEAFRALEQGHVIPDVARLSDEAETRQAMTLSEDASLAAARGPRVHRRARLRGRLPRDPRLRGHAAGRRRPPRPRAAHHAARRRPGAGRLARAARGCASATRARTCATRCSTTASWRRRSRRRRPGPGLMRPLRGGPGARSAARSRRAARRGS